MAGIYRLTAQTIAKRNGVGALNDGGGLYVITKPGGSRHFAFRYMLNGTRRRMGLGPLHTVSLEKARDLAKQARELLLQRIDPLRDRDAQHVTKLNIIANSKTFDFCAAAYIDDRRAGWKGGVMKTFADGSKKLHSKNSDQWESSLATYASPFFGKKDVAHVTSEDIVAALLPIWAEKTVTAERVQGRIENILDYATSKKYRAGENPGRWKGHLEHQLVNPNQVRKKKVPHPSVPYQRIGAYVKHLRSFKSVEALAIEFGILTVARKEEFQGAPLTEIDFKARSWDIPGERMKNDMVNRIPLCGRAMAILKELDKMRPANCKFIFPGGGDGGRGKRRTGDGGLSDSEIQNYLKDVVNPPRADGTYEWIDEVSKRPVVMHGFRSTFSTYVAEKTKHEKEVREACLSHKDTDEVSAAYQRGALFEKRRAVMDDWCKFVN
jgi:integrase